jgi:formylglycine-generating enzyme required for sulfatase activity
MGSDPTVDKDAQDDEQPQHTVEIGSDFYIGKYPVTNAQYAPFAKATGRKSPPAGRDDLPVVNVTWRDAVAFAEWLSQKTGQPFRLPVEPEWEKASRGEDGRLFPWDDDWDPKRANTWEDGPGQRTPVGAYSPDGDSPYGCADMAGNVWEWTGSLYRTYPYQQDDGREDPDSNGSPVVRGGSWENDRRSARCAYRGSRGPDDFLDVIGFRVVLSLPGLDAAPQSVVESAEPREPSHPAVFDLSVQAGASPLAADVARPSAAPGDATTKKPPKAVKKPTDHIRPDTFILTEPTRMEFVRVDGGSFLMGSDKTKYPDSRDDELPRRRIEVPEFFIGKYPVTNAQYASFAKATGRKAPLLGKEDHPVVNVGWRDAVAFTEWLSRQTGKPFRLPAEPEWEKAARGTDGRLWPWGNNWDPKRANTSEGGRGGTTPVGQYSPGGDSPYGCADMAGNVWEWTSSLSKPYPYDPGDGREDLQAGGPRVVRGGSWYDSQGLARAAYRLMYNPGDFDSSFGFRVALSLSS